jgi:Secretion system C-terminal sorting domain
MQWRVKTWDNKGNSVFSEIYNWIPAKLYPENKPVLLIPENYLMIKDKRSIEFSWEMLPKATEYEIEIYRSGDKVKFYSETFSLERIRREGSKAYQMIYNIFNHNATYTWHIRGRNINGDGPWSDTRYFIIDNTEEIPELEVEIISPKDSTKIEIYGPFVCIMGCQKFTCRYLEGFIQYELRIYEDNCHKLINSFKMNIIKKKPGPGIVNFGYFQPNLKTEYQYNFVARDSLGNPIVSDTFRLIPTGDMIEIVSDFISPENQSEIEISEEIIEFSWMAIDNARKYDIEIFSFEEDTEIYKNMADIFIISCDSTHINHEVYNVFSLGEYKWRVRGIDYKYEDKGPWSEYQYFKIVKPTGVEDLIPEEKYSVYPNPARNVVRISNNGNNNELLNIEIYYPNGELGKKIIDYKSGNDISLSKLAKGIYFLKIFSINGVYCTKFVKL